MSKIYYISHTKVDIDTDLADYQWRINEAGQQQLEASTQLPWFRDIAAIYSSNEQKTRDAAAFCARELGQDFQVREALGGTDRSKAGFLSNEDFAQAAIGYFQKPDESAFGWEPAGSVQKRNLEAFQQLVSETSGDTMIWGHGDSGTVLLCGLLGVPLDKSYDQPQLCSYFIYDTETGSVEQQWRPVEV